MQGKLISLEGIDGSGKTTLVNRLAEAFSAQYEIVKLREPGGTYISERIRDFLLDTQNSGMMFRTETLLYAAARSQVTEQIVIPALAAGKLVLADRFTDSTLAYQGYGRGLDLNSLRVLNAFCTQGIVPDLTILLDTDPEIGKRRRKRGTPDRIEKEGLEFQARVRQGYIDLWAKDPNRIRKVDAGQKQDFVFDQARKFIDSFLAASGF